MNINGFELIFNHSVLELLNNYDDNLYAPLKKDIFKAFELCSFENTKVVIIGQDPYPTKADAMGLSFSINPGKKLPKSLINIFKELHSDLGIERHDGNLEDIAIQGVLFLNTILSVEIAKPNSHKFIGWQETTNKVVQDLSARGHVIFVLLGNEAQKIASIIDESNNTIIKTSHPSPLGAYRGFNGSKIFSQINDACEKYNYEKISW